MEVQEMAEIQKVTGMKVKFIGESSPFKLTHGKIYDVLSIEEGFYRIIDETDEDYLYSEKGFEIIEKGQLIRPDKK